jgi:hypothetical protein
MSCRVRIVQLNKISLPWDKTKAFIVKLRAKGNLDGFLNIISFNYIKFKSYRYLALSAVIKFSQRRGAAITTVTIPVTTRANGLIMED